MNYRICKCCGEPMSVNEEPMLARANLCAACFSWPDDVDETDLADRGCLQHRMTSVPLLESGVRVREMMELFPLLNRRRVIDSKQGLKMSSNSV